MGFESYDNKCFSFIHVIGDGLRYISISTFFESYLKPKQN